MTRTEQEQLRLDAQVDAALARRERLADWQWQRVVGQLFGVGTVTCRACFSAAIRRLPLQEHRCRLDRPSVAFHVAPRSVRESIEVHGLDWRRRRDGGCYSRSGAASGDQYPPKTAEDRRPPPPQRVRPGHRRLPGRQLRDRAPGRRRLDPPPAAPLGRVGG